jgi:hypothetical protein
MKNNTFKTLSCEPSVTETINNPSCYNLQNINKLKKQWNLKHPDILINTDDPRKIWKFFKKTFNNVCKNEKCWLMQEFNKNNIDKQLLPYMFAPSAPISWTTDINTWLTSRDIMSILSQYEKKHSNFVFIGPSPIDFDKIVDNTCIWDELCNFDLTYYMNQGIDKISIVFNTDTHDKPGSHWVAMFININPTNEKPYIFYFDSNGNEIPKEINTLKNRIIDTYSKSHKPLKYINNFNIEHQKERSECGMYVLYFIIKLLYDTKTNYFIDKHNLITDTYVNQYRNKYFNII